MVYFIVCLLVASAIFYTIVLNTFFKLSSNKTAYPAIEGTRGYLAYFVFLHHLCIWYNYLHTGKWSAPPSHLFNHFGQAAVAFFFMITGFLFTNKLLDKQPLNWAVFFKKRFLRLFPLYTFAVLILLLLVLVVSGFKLNVSMGRFLDQFIHWLTFTYAGAPDINKVQNTYLIIAGVVWSLRYEIMFYAAVPFLGILFRKPARLITLILCLIVIVLFFVKTEHTDPVLFLNFISGITASLLHRYFKWGAGIKSDLVSVVSVFFILFSVYNYSGSDNAVSIFLQAAIFITITYGNNFFGILINTYSQVLGQLSYSIYMLHGMVLFVFNSFIFKRDFLVALDFNQFLLAGMLPAFFTVLISFLTYKYIEIPFLNSGRNRLSR